jgi:hypothetical protein
MKSTRASTATVDWSPGNPIYGPSSVYEGREPVQLKILSDRRSGGGGMACVVKFAPPEGKTIKIVAVARSDEHVFHLEGGYGTRAGRQLRFPGLHAQSQGPAAQRVHQRRDYQSDGLRRRTR